MQTSLIRYGTIALLIFGFAHLCGLAANRNLAQTIAHVDNMKLSQIGVTNLKTNAAAFSFDLDFDFESKLHWNHNVYYVYLVASYEKDNSLTKHTGIIWDKIFKPGDKLAFSAPANSMYFLEDPSDRLLGRPVSFNLCFYSIPKSGTFVSGASISEPHSLIL